MASKKWDVFISHASEDKEALVKPLAHNLRSFGVRVWYDEFSLCVGDSLSGTIDRGLKESRFGLVVLSPAFFTKKWPDYELRSLIAREKRQERLILPLWHRVEKADVLRFSPFLADKFAMVSDGKNPRKLALELIVHIRPKLFTAMVRRAAFLEAVGKAEVKDMPIDAIEPGPIRHKTLRDDQISRIRMIRAALCGVYSQSMDFWIDGFRRDMHPDDEIGWWKHLATCFLELTQVLRLNEEAEQRALYSAIFSVGMGIAPKDSVLRILPADAKERIQEVICLKLPPYDLPPARVAKVALLPDSALSLRYPTGAP